MLLCDRLDVGTDSAEIPLFAGLVFIGMCSPIWFTVQHACAGIVGLEGPVQEQGEVK